MRYVDTQSMLKSELARDKPYESERRVRTEMLSLLENPLFGCGEDDLDWGVAPSLGALPAFFFDRLDFHQ